ncbi:MAG: ABC transporter substrate-binding protein [Propionibacteriaceae bacterium]
MAHRKKTRALKLGAGLAVAAMLMSACGSAGDSDDPEDLAGRTITVLTLQDPFFYALKDLVPEFEEETGINVELDGADFATLTSRATNSLMSNQGDLDVLTPNWTWFTRFAESEWFEPLNERIAEDNDEVDIEDFIPNTLHSGSEWRGEMYTLPIASYAAGVIYRPSVFEELGLEEPPAQPSEGWTWDKYMENVKAIQGQEIDGKTMYGTTVLGAAPEPISHNFGMLSGSKGHRWFKAFPDSAEWDFTPTWTEPTSVDALNFYSELYQNSPEEAINHIFFDAGTQFASGNVGMMFHWTPYSYLVQRTEYMGDTESDIVDDYALAALPQEPGQDQAVASTNHSLGIAANSENKAAAWEFIKWASSAKTQKKMGLTDLRQFADFSRYSLYEDEELAEAYPWLPVQLTMLENTSGKTVMPPAPNYSNLEQIVGNSLNRMLVEGQSGEATAESINDQLTQIQTDQGFLPWEGESYDDSLDNTEHLIDQIAGGG